MPPFCPGVKEAGWTIEEDDQRPGFLLVINGVRSEQTPANRIRFMAQVRGEHSILHLCGQWVGTHCTLNLYVKRQAGIYIHWAISSCRSC